MKYIVIACFALFTSACASGPFADLFNEGVSIEEIDTANKALATAATQIGQAARLTASLVRAGAITPGQATLVRDGLQTALDAVELAKNAVQENGDPSQAETAIETAQTSVAVALTLLSGFTGAPANELQGIMENGNTSSEWRGHTFEFSVSCLSLDRRSRTAWQACRDI